MRKLPAINFHKAYFIKASIEIRQPGEKGHQIKTAHQAEPEKWVMRYGNLLFGYCMPRVDDRGLAEDLVQDTFLSALKSLDSFKGEASEKNWLFSILKNKIIDHYRKKAAAPAVTAIPGLADFSDEWFTPEGRWREDRRPGEWHIPEGPAEQEELQKLINWCRARLKELQQKVFVLKYLEEQDSACICSVLGISASNYWILLHRARLQMRECLERRAGKK